MNRASDAKASGQRVYILNLQPSRVTTRVNAPNGMENSNEDTDA